MFQKFVNPQQTQAKEEPKMETVEKNEKPVDGFDFLVKEIKQTYELTLPDEVILEALKKSNGDVEKALSILFS